MKKLLFLLLIPFSILLYICIFDNPKYINFTAKPNNYYYSNQIYKKLKNSEEFTLKVFDSDLSRYYTVAPEDNDIILSFLESLNKTNYIDKESDDMKNRPSYELSIQFQDTKYIINAYSKDLVTIYPWDGSYKEDMLNMEGVSTRNNIYDFCVYVINKAHEN